MHFASFHLSSSTYSTLQNMAIYAAFAALVLSLLAILYAIMLARRIDRLSLGKSGSFEETIGALTAHMKDTQTFRVELEAYLKHIESRMRSSIRGVGVVRFNAFQNGAGGNQSFAIALIDEALSGVVFSALYARDHVGVYAKPLIEGKSTFTLSEEELQAVDKAKNSLSQSKRGAHK